MFAVNVENVVEHEADNDNDEEETSTGQLGTVYVVVSVTGGNVTVTVSVEAAGHDVSAAQPLTLSSMGKHLVWPKSGLT